MNTYQFLQKHIFFSTRELAFQIDRSISSVSRTLKQWEEKKIITQLTRGIWAQFAHPHFSCYGAVPYLLENEQGYISFLTGLHRHGILSQIPSSIQIATTGHSRRLKTSIGIFEFFRIHPKMMLFGANSGIIQFQGAVIYNIASLEKALLDTFYISVRKGRRFSSLPELDLTAVNEKIFLKLLKEQITHPMIRKSVLRKWGLLRC